MKTEKNRDLEGRKRKREEKTHAQDLKEYNLVFQVK